MRFFFLFQVYKKGTASSVFCSWYTKSETVLSKGSVLYRQELEGIYKEMLEAIPEHMDKTQKKEK